MSIKNFQKKNKYFLLFFLRIINLITKYIPRKFIILIVKITVLIGAYTNNPRKDLILIFKIKDEIEKILNNRALAFGNHEHPKHYLTNYHKFFIDNINDGEKVIDIGCGYGSVSRSVALAKQNSIILGIDNDIIRLRQAQSSQNPKNLSFIYGNAVTYDFAQDWDVVILSNVIEHIESRIDFLKSIISNIKPKRILIRVPNYERDWQIPLRDQLGINYFTDSDHKIEHKLNEFSYEIGEANLNIEKVITNWGEIWAVCLPKGTY